MGFGSVTSVVESMGANLMAGPYLATQLATWAIVTSASEAQKNEWLPAIVGGAPASVAITEPDGSWLMDEPSATGVVDADSVRLAGEKTFVLDLDGAALVLVSVMLDGDPRLINNFFGSIGLCRNLRLVQRD